MKISFRSKIALLSFVVSAALLTSFGFSLFAFVYTSAVERMDSEIRVLIEAPLRGPSMSDFWDDVGRSLNYILGGERAEQVALLVLDAERDVLLQTTNTPISLLTLPCPDPVEGLGDMDYSFGPPGPGPDFDDLDSFYDPFGGPGGSHPGDRGWKFDRPSSQPIPPSAIHYYTMDNLGVSWRVGILATESKTIFVAMEMDAFYAEINHFRNRFMVAVFLGLLLCGFVGWFLADRAMQPVALIADAADGITARGLDQRVPQVAKDVELERLVYVFNGMLDRLEKSYHQAVRFSADAAHELQTPLTILQGELDNAIQAAPDGSDEQQCYSMLLDELRNLKAVVQKLLLLAHADEGRLNLNRTPVDLHEMIYEAAEDFEIMAPELDVSMQVNEHVQVLADRALLNQVIRNMISNAAKYSTQPGQVIFALQTERGSAVFRISNTAVPIPEADRPLLFERFHRVDKARSAAGSGLGLSLAREIARAHGGELSLDDYRDGMVSFILRLPLG